MNYWLFQGNPKIFDVLGYLSDLDEIDWTIRQKHLAPDIKKGDTAFIWLAKGDGERSGVVARCSVLEEPSLTVEHPEALKYWKSDEEKENASEPALMVKLRVEDRCLGKKEIIKAEWLKEDPVFSDHRIFKMRSETNYRVSIPEGERLSRLVENTGKDWTRSDSIAGLWAYSQTYEGPLSRKDGSPISDTALTIGRAVGGVYNKVLNFRALDPRDERAGLSASGENDKLVWAEFFDEEKQTLKKEELNKAFKALFGSGSKSQERKKVTYKDFGEAPDDDPEELRLFALKVRKGQPKFRKKLIALYNGKCAISGSGPESVLEAAHIESHAKTGINSSENGLLLRSDLHTLFDAGLIRVKPDSLSIEIDPELKGTLYESFAGRILRERTDGSKPSEEFLSNKYQSEKSG